MRVKSKYGRTWHRADGKGHAACGQYAKVRILEDEGEVTCKSCQYAEAELKKYKEVIHEDRSPVVVDSTAWMLWRRRTGAL